ncbi:alpha/beta hydrolase [Aequorivita marina]|uniref:alpha/beta hydrolase n=1 Tax=Aequorivita marina TaxID=3073654 RepID=UPI002876C628|nr:esterase [Aequorivita sp. S2608]MDS1297571.1 esterase [Aequorivita sp. S2608]
MSLQKEVSYQTSNTYSTLNTLSEKTKNVWLVFHGMGYLSKYFINYFSELNTDENYIIAPQAPSKYYQDKKFKHVGASWLTRENTTAETENILNYIDAVYNEELSGNTPNLIVLGYSQGVSIAARWVARHKIQCNKLILHSGAIPKELKPKDFEFLNTSTQVIYLYGNKDQYVTEARKTEAELNGSKLFKDRLTVQVFEGVHEVNKDFILTVSKEA